MNGNWSTELELFRFRDILIVAVASSVISYKLPTMNVLFLLGRLIFGGFFLMNAWSHFKNLDALTGYAQSKGVPSSRAAVFVSGILLLLGGLGVVFGISPEASLALLIIFLVPVTFMMHAYWKETDPNMKMMQRIQFYKNLALIGACLMLYAIPVPWVYNVLH